MISETDPASDILAERRRTWKRKEILRRLYERWYRKISEAARPGLIIELGGGSGNIKDFFPHAVTTDVVHAPWLDAVLDAHRLPLKEGSVDTIVLFDVLHHLEDSLAFFDEAERVLKPGGRVVMMEPYVSWLSYPVYRFLHPEGMDGAVNPFEKGKGPTMDKDPFQGNQAIPKLLFERHRAEFLSHFPELRIIREERTDPFLYPLSGGFHHPGLCPVAFWKPLALLEKMAQPLARYLAFRMFLVLEKL
ncbi:MAG: class I SAM-dependent methyltransferase [Deltaproteobacteria bacterium]|nr:class I SAM-dependent methyltransferase [Deltaproteobacteria bacterium]MBW2138547.1 class I SAM-dependent methyltransferase [Deltaproteobacteria bacterium]